jgi:uncharacterized protein (DUF433 family)
MTIELSPAERQYLESVIARKQRPTRRQRAQVLLHLGKGETVKRVAQLVGIAEAEVKALKAQFQARRIGVVDHGSAQGKPLSRKARGIEKTPGICGGSARISGTRIPVWQLVAARDLGASEAQLLADYPRLRAVDLVNAWSYARSHHDEIDAEIHQNEVA